MRQFKGEVIRTKMNKTATIEVVRLKIHPIYKKRMKVKKKFHAHDELGVKVGDQVIITETKPISKTKKWKVLKVVKK
ncbi:30S ribosomal protein S17 [Microgenomates group bacterium RBG_19FT_COMBO_39_10]|nr:ribosomal protein S17 [uncultured bacterium]OGV89206.1 MAG: 30S ribosomal protein S17 [Microgenomates group bacterium RBG_19FT_COMBO_39_10]